MKSSFATWLELEVILLSEIGHAQKGKDLGFSLWCGIYKEKLISQKLRVQWWLSELGKREGNEEWKMLFNDTKIWKRSICVPLHSRVAFFFFSKEMLKERTLKVLTIQKMKHVWEHGDVYPDWTLHDLYLYWNIIGDLWIYAPIYM